MKIEEIRDIARRHQINPVGLFKTELVRSIQSHEGNANCYATSQVRECGQVGCLWRSDCQSEARKSEGK